MISICLNYISVRSGSKQLASILNFLLSVVGTFVFGYIASQYAFPSVAMVMKFCMLLSYKKINSILWQGAIFCSKYLNNARIE